MTVNLSPIWGAGAQLFDNSGNVLSGGKIYTYAAGTTTPATTYTSSSGITANSNPIILNSAGRVPYEIWLSSGIGYKYVLKDNNDTLIATYDNLTGINSNFINSVKDFGAVGDGITDDSAAVLAMQSAVGYVLFTAGIYAIGTSITVNTPIYFNADAQVSINSGIYFTISEAFINAPKQQIFSGNGEVRLIGERTVEVMAEWFGVTPGLSASDQGPNLSKLFAACPSTRECYISFGVGSFYFYTAPSSIPRAVKIQGAGERLTNFVFMGALQTSGDFFVTSGEGCTFSNIQFTCTDGTSRRTSGALITLNHQYCNVNNIWYTDSFGGVDVNANNCNINGITSFRNSRASGSYLVKLQGAKGYTTVSNIRYLDSTALLGPEYAIRVENHGHFTISNVKVRGGNACLGFVPSTGSCFSGFVQDIDADSATIVSGVVINPTGTGSIDSIKFSKVRTNALSQYGFLIKKDTSGILKYVEIIHLDAQQSGVCGLKIVATVGQAENISVTNGFARQGLGDGYDIDNVQKWSMIGTQTLSNAGTGTIIGSNCSSFVYTNNINLDNTTANFTDNSGAVTKVVANNI